MNNLDSYASDINLGQIVGTLRSPYNPSSPLGAFIWDEVNGMQNLNDLIDPSVNWQLDSAVGINDLGQIVGFSGTMGAKAFLLNPVSAVSEPSMTVLMLGGFGVVGLMATRRKKQS